MVAAGMVVFSTVFCALMPALQATRPALAPALKQEAMFFGYRRWNVRTMVVTGQVAVSVLLLVVTALFLRNLGMAGKISPEFDAAKGVVAQVSFVEGRQGTASAPAAAALADRLRQLPGVESAAIAQGVPLTARYGGETGTDMRLEGHEQPVHVRYFSNAVGPDYFETLGLKVLRGRDFTAADRQGAPRVIVINHEFAQRYFAGEDPVGRHVVNVFERPNAPPAQIVGVVSNSKYSSIGEDRSAAVYSSYLQGGGASRFAHVIVRTSLAPESVTGAIGAVIAAFDASAAYTVEPMTTSIAFSFLPSRIGAALIGALGVLGMVLAMIGLYGTVSYAVSRRTSEIGIRIALGASRVVVMRLVMTEGGLLVSAGTVIGLLMAAAATAPLRAFLVADLSTTDAFSYIATVVVLGLTSLAACWSPARRATRVQPAASLRAE
jgi:predicted permease